MNDVSKLTAEADDKLEANTTNDRSADGADAGFVIREVKVSSLSDEILHMWPNVM
jgi:hypothetical protein